MTLNDTAIFAPVQWTEKPHPYLDILPIVFTLAKILFFHDTCLSRRIVNGGNFKFGKKL